MITFRMSDVAPSPPPRCNHDDDGIRMRMELTIVLNHDCPVNISSATPSRSIANRPKPAQEWSASTLGEGIQAQMDLANVLNNDKHSLIQQAIGLDPVQPSQCTKTQRGRPQNTDERPRIHRPKYTEEEMLFIWYHRTDRALDWNAVEDCFNQAFNRQSRNSGGLQCKFYRYLHEWNVEDVRQQNLFCQSPEPGCSLEEHRPDGGGFGVVVSRIKHPAVWLRGVHCLARFSQYFRIEQITVSNGCSLSTIIDEQGRGASVG